MRLPERLPIDLAKEGASWQRIHKRDRDPLWFGPREGRPPIGRFDDPDRVFRVCYLGTTMAACFAESFLRTPPVRTIALAELKAKSITTIVARRALRLVRLYGPGLARIGATAEISSGSSYNASQLWSRAIWEHSETPDGITYRCRHDDSALCVALYDRAKESLEVKSSIALDADPRALAQLLKRYELGLTRPIL